MGTEVKPAEAISLLERAADGLSASAMIQLGRCYEVGIAVQADADKAFDWYWAGARLGSPEACYRLGLMLQEGRGCTANTQKAIKWFKEAAKHHHSRALQKLEEINTPS